MAEANQTFDFRAANATVSADIDKLFKVWFDENTYESLKHDENFSPDETLDKLTTITTSVLAACNNKKSNTAAYDIYTKLKDYLAGDASACIDLLNNRDKNDPISKLLWLINISTPVAVLSQKLADVNKPLKKGPFRKLNISAKNVEKVIANVPNSKQMKTTTDLLTKVLPNSFAACAKYKHLLKTIDKRAAFSGNQYHNIETFDSMYRDLGEAMVLVSTDFFVEANNAFTENGKRYAADKAKFYDFNKLSSEEQNKMMRTMAASFRKYANYTVELNMFSNINDKIIMDSALNVFYTKFNDQQRVDCGFNEDDLVSLPKAMAFARKYPNEFRTAYDKYSSELVNGMTDALTKEQTTVKKEWFENKLTGERIFRRGRLAGHGNKFMHTAPMEWLDGKLKDKSWISFWAIPKLAMTTLKVLTHPALHKLRKKVTSTIFAGLREFGRGVKESFTSTGKSSEVTYDDVVKVIKDAEAKLKKITDEKTKITAESVKNTSKVINEADEEQEEANTITVNNEQLENILKIVNAFNKCADLFDKAVSDEALNKDNNAYKDAYEEANELINNALANTNAKAIIDASDIEFADDVGTDEAEIGSAKQTIEQLKSGYQKFISNKEEYDSKEKEREDIDKSNAKDKSDTTDNPIEVGEESVKICEDVFDVLNKYIARQWNLLALHSTDARMQMCAMYTTIDTDQYIKGATPPNDNDDYIVNTNKELVKDEAYISSWLDHMLYEVDNEQQNAESLYKLSQDSDAEPEQESKANKREGSANSQIVKNVHADDFRPSNKEEDVKNKAEANKNAQFTNSLADAYKKLRNEYANEHTYGNYFAHNYPWKYDGKYRYHGITLNASTLDNSKNGFGIFTERLTKIDKLVTEFCDYVDMLGNESSKKTFDNSKKDQPADAIQFNSNAEKLAPEDNHVKEALNAALAFKFTANDLLNEDIANKVITAGDKALDKAADVVKKPINSLGKVAGKGIGKLVHGITHTSTADKDETIAKTIEDNMELTYTFSKSLRLSYLRDGANILAKHCLNKAAVDEFTKIADFTKALADADFANAHSIVAVKNSLNSFASSMKNVMLKPCKSIIDYAMANLLVRGFLNDSANPKYGLIKGLYIGNFEAATTAARAVSTDDVKTLNTSTDNNNNIIDEKLKEAKQKFNNNKPLTDEDCKLLNIDADKVNAIYLAFSTYDLFNSKLTENDKQLAANISLSDEETKDMNAVNKQSSYNITDDETANNEVANIINSAKLLYDEQFIDKENYEYTYKVALQSLKSKIVEKVDDIENDNTSNDADTENKPAEETSKSEDTESTPAAEVTAAIESVAPDLEKAEVPANKLKNLSVEQQLDVIADVTNSINKDNNDAKTTSMSNKIKTFVNAAKSAYKNAKIALAFSNAIRKASKFAKPTNKQETGITDTDDKYDPNYGDSDKLHDIDNYNHFREEDKPELARRYTTNAALAKQLKGAKSVSLSAMKKQNYNEEDVKNYAKQHNIKITESVDVAALHNKLDEEINKLDWKDILNG